MLSISKLKNTESPVSLYTANTSKFSEKYCLDLKNMFSKPENITIFYSKQENKLTEKNFLVPSARNLTCIENISQNKTNFFILSNLF